MSNAYDMAQVLCKNGHYDEVDHMFVEEWKCPHCSEKAVWRNRMDISSGNDNRIKLKVKFKETYCPCQRIIGQTHYHPAVYYIP